VLTFWLADKPRLLLICFHVPFHMYEALKQNWNKTISIKKCASFVLARLMGQYCFAGWRLSSSVVICNTAGVRAVWMVGAPVAGRVGGCEADTARRASTDTFH